MKTFYLDKTLLNGTTPIFYKEELDGGGKTWIDLMKDYPWPKVNSIMEMCCGPGFMGYYLKHKYKIPKLTLVDIHEPVRSVIEKTNKINNWGSEVDLYISDAFEQYEGEMVDMIVSNPPHLKSQQEFEDYKYNTIDDNPRILLDDNLNFHKKFLNKLHNFLNPSGYLILLENKNNIPAELIIELNPTLKLVDYIDHDPLSLYTGVFKFI